ncbi:hypothetical protein [Diplocloster modestus]|uniref:Lantibiotic n=1 Tax=Diplocloster modestus TaxID=2850322 RepID=A0ABS6K9X9_9FIRM|nr:hypothetical protein [Diplocloster modestus]MBU9727315.1 hypothetical protein [Diplocloster modestus]
MNITKDYPAGNIIEELNSQNAVFENTVQAPDFTFTVGCSTVMTIICC